MITYHGYNNPVYNVHKNVSAPYTQQNMVCWHVCPHYLKKPEELGSAVLVPFVLYWSPVEVIMNMHRWHFAPSALNGCNGYGFRLLIIPNPSVCVTKTQVHLPCKWHDAVLKTPMGTGFHLNLSKRRFDLVFVFCHPRMLRSLPENKEVFSIQTVIR